MPDKHPQRNAFTYETATFVPQDKRLGIQLNQKDSYPDGDAVEDADIFDANQQSAAREASGNETKKEMAEINPRNETPYFAHVYIPEIVACRTTIKRDILFGIERRTSARSQYPPMGIDRNQYEGLPCTSIPVGDENLERVSTAASSDNKSQTMGPAPLQDANTPTYGLGDLENPDKSYALIHLQRSTRTTSFIKLVEFVLQCCLMVLEDGASNQNPVHNKVHWKRSVVPQKPRTADSLHVKVPRINIGSPKITT